MLDNGAALGRLFEIMKKPTRKPAKVEKASKKAAKKLAKKVAKAGGALERAIQVLEDIEEVTKLKARYCNYVDGGWDRLTHDYDGVGLFVRRGRALGSGAASFAAKPGKAFASTSRRRKTFL